MFGLSKTEFFRAHVANSKLGLTPGELSLVLKIIKNGVPHGPTPLQRPLESKAQLIEALEEIIKDGSIITADGIAHEVYDQQISAGCKVILEKIRKLSEEENFSELAQRILRAKIGLKPIQLHYVLNLITHGLPKLGQRQPQNLDQLLALIQLIIKNPAKAWGDKPGPDDRKVAENWINILACLRQLKAH